MNAVMFAFRGHADVRWTSRERVATTRATSHEPRATSHEPRATSHEPRATSHEPRATSHEQLSMKIYLVRFQFSKLFPIHQFSKFAFIGKMIETCVSLLVTDTVEKVCFSERTNFSRGTGASIRKLYRGTHSQTDFQPAAFVTSL
jgi:hypothetical protein